MQEGMNLEESEGGNKTGGGVIKNKMQGKKMKDLRG